MITADTRTVQPPALTVDSEHQDRWFRLLMTAQERGLRIWADLEMNSFTDAESRNTAVFGVTSHSVPGLLHRVTVERVDDTTFTQCDCPAGWVPIGCTHASLALYTSGWWPFREAGTRTIPLTKGQEAIVDEADYEWLSRGEWWAKKGRSTYYAEGSLDGVRTKMHRFILNAQPGQIVDHINHNGLDNRRANLRLCTQSENHRNRPARVTTGASRFKGVSVHAQTGKWRATITLKREADRRSLGLFETEEDAARAYDAAARLHFGDFASLNFPAEQEVADDGLAVDSEQPLQPARYAVGQAVKLVWQQRRTFWVHDATFDGTGWRYQLADEARRVVLEADEHKVRPAVSKRSVAA